MTKPANIIPANHKAAIEIINSHISKHLAAETGALRSIQADIIRAGLHVLSTVTGREYHIRSSGTIAVINSTGNKKGGKTMTVANHKAAIDLINGYIREYEKTHEMTTDSKEWQRNKRDYQNRLTAGLEVLSAVTGREYHWTRTELPNGKLYSGVIRLGENGNDDAYDNCAVFVKGGVTNV